MKTTYSGYWNKLKNLWSTDFHLLLYYKKSDRAVSSYNGNIINTQKLEFKTHWIPLDVFY
jgi:hypothetical protein